MVTVLIAAVVMMVVSCLWVFIRRLPHPIDQLPGPPTLPFFGNALSFVKSRQEGFKTMCDNAKKYHPLYRIWLSKFVPVINAQSPEYVETILSSTEHLTKSYEYTFLSQWLGYGLVTSTGAKWHANRKMLTPAFHFSILEQFVPVFCDNTRILVEKLKVASKHNPYGVDIVPYVVRCTLDMICETSMGYSVHAQEGTNTNKYVTSVSRFGELLFYRNRRPWLFPDWIFNLTSAGREFEKCVKYLHDFTNMVIRKRREEMKLSKSKNTEIAGDTVGRKKRIAFLDLMLKISEQDPTFTDEDIRAEVDTFMFAGHDTTGMTISWVLHFLGVYPEIQSRCVEELEEIFGGSGRDPDFGDLNSMKCLERVIKETLRVRPPAWFIGRKLEKSIKFEGYDEFTPGTVIYVNIYHMHHNSDIFPNPEKFDPDRFLPENCIKRHPFAFIPFSAGPRNCIGQRFAMLEMKEVVSTVLRHFRLESCDPEFYGEACPDILLRPLNGIHVRLYPRETQNE